MLLSHQKAEERYTEIRRAILKAAEGKFASGAGLKFRLVDEMALAQAGAWPQAARRVDWNWVQGYHHFQFRNPKRFELALWHQGQLASLSLGRPTSKGAGLRLDFIEASPPPRSIQVFPLILITMTAYAEALGVDEIRLVDPINEAVKNYYEGFGLSYVRKGNYLFKRI